MTNTMLQLIPWRDSSQFRNVHTFILEIKTEIFLSILAVGLFVNSVFEHGKQKFLKTLSMQSGIRQFRNYKGLGSSRPPKQSHKTAALTSVLENPSLTIFRTLLFLHNTHDIFPSKNNAIGKYIVYITSRSMPVMIVYCSF